MVPIQMALEMSGYDTRRTWSTDKYPILIKVLNKSIEQMPGVVSQARAWLSSVFARARLFCVLQAWLI
jgi:hypothetical protein